MKNPELENKILEILSQENPPDTIEGIYGRLLEKTFTYMHDVSRTIWQLASEGRIVVLSGRIASVDTKPEEVDWVELCEELMEQLVFMYEMHCNGDVYDDPLIKKALSAIERSKKQLTNKL
jgi:hypothetical protein